MAALLSSFAVSLCTEWSLIYLEHWHLKCRGPPVVYLCTCIHCWLYIGRHGTFGLCSCLYLCYDARCNSSLRPFGCNVFPLPSAGQCHRSTPTELLLTWPLSVSEAAIKPSCAAILVCDLQAFEPKRLTADLKNRHLKKGLANSGSNHPETKT